jgi:hypothetical protein
MMKVIHRWEQSGNGGGQRAPDDPNFGRIFQAVSTSSSFDVEHTEESVIDGNNRASFLQNEATYVLYMWHLLESAQILRHTVSIMNAENWTTSTTAPATLPSSASKKKKSQEKLEASLLEDNKDRTKTLRELLVSNNELVASNNALARNKSIKQYVSNCEKEAKYTQLLSQLSNDDPLRKVYEKALNACIIGAALSKQDIEQLDKQS